MLKKRTRVLALAAAAAATVPMVSQALGATITWTGTTPDPTTYTVSASGTAAGITSGTVYIWNNTVQNFSLGGSPVAYTAGDEVVFTDNFAGGTVIRVANANTNPSGIRFIDAGAGATNYILTRSQDFASYTSNPVYGTNHSMTLTLDTGFNGIVSVRPRALTGTLGNTIIRSGVLQVGDGLPLPNSGNANAPNVELAGGELWINVNEPGNTQPANSNLIGALNVTANSVFASNAVTATRLWGQSPGSININPGVTLTVKSNLGNTLNATSSNWLGTGTLLLADGSVGSTNFQVNGNFSNSNLSVNLGTGNSSFTVNTNANLGALYGGVNTRLIPGAANTVTIGGNNANTTFDGIITQGSIAKAGTGSLTLTNVNTHAGATNVTGGALVLSGATGTAANSASINISGNGTLRLDNTTNNNNRINDNATITLSQGNLVFVGNLAAPTAEAAGTLVINGGVNKVTTIPSGVGSTAAITFLGLTRTSGVVDFDTSLSEAASVNIAFTNAPSTTNGIIGGYATVNGSNWANVSGLNIVAYTHAPGETDSAPGSWAPTLNINLTDGTTKTVTTTTTINSLRVANGNVAINAGAGLIIGSGGLLAPGTTNPTISGPGSITAGTGAAADLLVQVPNSANTLTITAPISDNGAGTNTLVKAGAGKLVLGGANTFSGGLSIGGGSVVAGAPNVFNGGVLTVDFGNTFDIGGFNQSFGTVILINGTVANTGGAATLTGTSLFNLQNGTVTASLGGAGSLNKTTGNAVSLNTANTFTGGWTVGAGTLVTGVADALPSNSTGTVSGGVLSIGAVNQNVASLTVTGGTVAGTTAVITSSGGIDLQGGTISAIIGGATTVTKNNGANTATLSALNTYTGITTVNQGTLAIATLANGGSPSGIGQSSNAAANLVLNGGGTLDYRGTTTVSTDRQFTINGDAGFANNGTGTVTLASTSAIQGSGVFFLLGSNTGQNLFNGVITGGMGLGKSGGGTWLLGQANTYTGEFRALNGTLSIQTFNQSTGKLVLNGGNIIGTGIVTPNDTDLISGSVATVIAGTANINKNGASNTTATLTAANTINGTITINAGTLAVSVLANGGVASGLGTSPLNAGSLEIKSNGTLAYVGTTTASTNRLFKIEDAGIAASGTGNGTVSFTNTGAIDMVDRELRLTGTNTGTNTFAPLISGTGSRLLKAGAGQWVVTNNNTYAGSTSITGGTLTVNTLANGGLASPIGQSTSDAANLILGGGALKYAGAGATIDRNFTLGNTNGAAAAGSGTIDSSGTGPLVFSQTANPIAMGSGTGGRTLGLTGTNTGANQIAGNIADASGGSLTSVTKAGTGTWRLTGTNTYTGATTAGGGSLILGRNAHGPVLTGAGGGIVNAGRLVLDYSGGGTDPATLVGTTLKAGNAGNFLTGQIRTTNAANAGRALGWIDDTVNSQVRIAYTYRGDSDLDGDADGVDIGTWATNFSGELSGGPSATRIWSQGDWDYDGDVDGVDAGLWATNFTGELSGGGLGAVVVDSPISSEASAILQGLGITVVPEPATVGLLGLGLVGGLARRARRRQA